MHTSDHQTPKASILVVDDTHDNLRLLSGILTKQGYTVRPVPDGTLALVSAQNVTPDLILLDIMMPNLSGYEVCAQLKADARTRDIPVIFISALHEVFDKVKAFTIGGVDYITKPFHVEEVLARVATHVALRKLHQALQENNRCLHQEIAERVKAEAALTDSLRQIERAKQEWESSADSLSYVVCLLDEHQRVLRVNRTVEQWQLGVVTEVQGRGFHDLLHPACQDAACYLQTFLQRAGADIARGRAVACEARDPVLQRYLSVQLRPIADQAESVRQHSASFAVGSVHDLTERKRAEEALQQRNHELALLNQMGDLLQSSRSEEDTYRVIVSVCQQFFPADSGGLYLLDGLRTMLRRVAAWGNSPPHSPGFHPDECWSLHTGQSLLVREPDAAALCPQRCSDPAHGSLCVPIDTLEGSLGVLHLCFGPDEPGEAAAEVRHRLELKRITVTRVIENYAMTLVNLRLREMLRMEAIRDPLTNLYNRRYLEESLEREARRAQRNHTAIGIIMLDIDHFKRFNDRHGHEAGDLVLQELGMLLQNSIRGGDIACRYGGEEFLLILPETTLPIVEKRAEELLHQVRQRGIPYQDTFFQITVSIGVASLSEYATELQDVIHTADKALYQAKAQGRNQVVVAAPPNT